MQVSQKTHNGREKEPGKFLKIVLFWTIFLFIIFIGKRIIGYPKGSFIINNLISFACAVILSGTMLHFLSVKSLKLSIPIIWLLTILLISFSWNSGPFSFTATFDGNNSWTGFSLGFLPKGIGLGIFAHETHSARFPIESSSSPCGN